MYSIPKYGEFRTYFIGKCAWLLRDGLEYRISHATFQSWKYYRDMPNDHFNFAENTEGPHSGYQAFGIGTNKAKITKVCRIGLVSILQQGRVGLASLSDTHLESSH